MRFHYVYILRSIKYPDRYYTGLTEKLEERLCEHNHGRCFHTSKFVPLEIKTAIAFADLKKAMKFEKYLKSASGRAIAKKACEGFEQVSAKKTSFGLDPSRSILRGRLQ